MYANGLAFPRQLCHTTKSVNRNRRWQVIVVFILAKINSKPIISGNTINSISYTLFCIRACFEYAHSRNIHVFRLNGIIPYFAVNMRQFPDRDKK